MFEVWLEAISLAGYNVMRYPYYIVFDPGSKSARKLTCLSAQNRDCVAIMKLTEKHPKKFLPDYSVPFPLLGFVKQFRTSFIAFW